MLGDRIGIDKVQIAYELRQKGYGLRRIAKHLGVSHVALYYIFKKYPTFLEYAKARGEEIKPIDEKTRKIIFTYFEPLAKRNNMEISKILEIAYHSLIQSKEKEEKLNEEINMLKNQIERLEKEKEKLSVELAECKLDFSKIISNAIGKINYCSVCKKEIQTIDYLIFVLWREKGLTYIKKKLVLCPLCYNNFITSLSKNKII